MRLYDLRHTVASLLDAADAPITRISTQLGHVNLTTTLVKTQRVADAGSARFSKNPFLREPPGQNRWAR